MQIKNGASVYTTDGKDVGKIDRVVLDPRTDEITHIVVRKGWLFTTDKVVPISLVSTVSEDEVQLRDDARDFDDLPDYEETYYVPIEDIRGAGGAGDAPARSAVGAVDYASYAPSSYWYPPAGAIWPGYYTGTAGYALPNYVSHTEQNIPEGTVALKEGADVYSADGKHVGKVEEILTNAQLNRATHLLITEGWLFPEKRLIPVDWINHVDENSIDLVVRSSALDRIPAYQP